MKGSVRFLLTAGTAMAVLSAAAAPLSRTDLPANPAWLLHIDCDALRQTYLGKYILHYIEKPEMRSNVVAFRSIFNFDFRTQLRGVTAYGASSATNDGAVIIYADFDPAHLAALAMGASAAEAITNNQHVIYGWLNEKPNPVGPEAARNYAAILTGRAIIGKNKDNVREVLAAIDGAAPNFSAGKGWPDPAGAGETTFLQATARDLNFLGSDTIGSVVKLSRQVTLRVSETNEQLNAVLTLETGDENTAKQMSIVAQGQIALLSMQKDYPKAAKLADVISVQQEGPILRVTLSVPSNELVAALKAYDAAKKKP